uniref:Uncharacterized protein n=1 Tax=Anguilla anguilla TaxID=7936 RepID=A0A0E9USV9_ANGAN
MDVLRRFKTTVKICSYWSVQ